MKDIPEYENLYSITPEGRVWSKRRGHFMKPILGTKGYLQICLFKNKKPTCFYIHRLVANTYIAPVDGRLYINHKNSDRADNRIENLEWCTQRENVLHGFKQGRINGRAKLTTQQVSEIRKKHASKYGDGVRLAKEYGVSTSVISKIATGQAWGRVAS